MAVAEDLTGAAAPAASQARAGGRLKPPLLVKLAYAPGQFIESGYLGVNAFIFFYYTAVLGLSGGMVGLALAIAMAVDAVFDPLVGSLSDNVRSRFGRRLPVMLIGAPLAALTLGLLFAPPSNLSPFLLFGWLTATKIGLRGFASMFNLPYFALGAEMADDYVERSRIVAWRNFGGIVIGVLITFLGYGYFFAGEGGLQKLDNYPRFGWTIAGIVLAGAAVCCAGVWAYASRLPQPKTPPRPMLSGLGPEAAEIFRNPSFRTLFLSALLAYIAAGLNGALNSHMMVFVWKVRPETIQFISYALLLGVTMGVIMTPLLLRVMEKRTAVLWGIVLVVICWSLLAGLRAAGLFTLTGDAVLPWLSANAWLAGVGVGLMAVAYPSMMADAADEHEVLFGHRREGMYFAGLGFAAKSAAGAGALLGGIALDLVGFPKEAGREAHAVLAPDVLSGLALTFGPISGIIAVIASAWLIPYRITRERHLTLSEALKAKRAAEVAHEPGADGDPAGPAAG